MLYPESKISVANAIILADTLEKYAEKNITNERLINACYSYINDIHSMHATESKVSITMYKDFKPYIIDILQQEITALENEIDILKEFNGNSIYTKHVERIYRKHKKILKLFIKGGE